MENGSVFSELWRPLTMGRYSQTFHLRPDPLGKNSVDILVRVCLFRSVKNAKELKQMLQNGQLECSLIRAELILEPFQLLAAANKAVHNDTHAGLSTRNVHSEIVYCLSPTKHITESLLTFGIHDDSQDILVVIVGDSKGDKLKHVGKYINGRPEILSAIKSVGNYDLVKQIYHVKDPELNKASIVDAIVSRIVSKDYVV